MDLSALDGTNGFRLLGALNDRAGFSVSNAGDVNGDGFDDLIVGAPGLASAPGASYLVFGKASGFASNLDLSALNGTNGFRLSGAAADDHAGISVSGAGDVNGDGYADLIVGAYAFGLNDPGASYVVFGKASGFTSNLNLAALNGTTGFRLSGEATNDFSGNSVSSAGDVNGDGYDDLIVGAYRAAGGIAFGASYVVFGKASGFASNLNLTALDGANGFKLSGAAGGDRAGISVSGAGDVNGDGFDDLIVGASGADPNFNGLAGASYLVFGRASGFASNLNLSALDGANGFRLSGTTAADNAGISVSNAGDVNGDGFGDLIVGAFGVGSGAGASYVVFGKGSGFASNLDLSALDGANGFRLSGAAMSDNAGFSVSSAGDVNGDGFGDLIVGARYAGPIAYSYYGASYVVYGKASGFAPDLSLSALDGTNGFQLSGEMGGDQSGRSVSGAGDVNGDGFDDLIVGAYGANSYAGASYVVYGGDFTGAVTFLGTVGADTLTGSATAETFVSSQGDDSLVGGGGADVFNAGSGNDRIEVASTAFAHLDGGSGLDTLALAGGGLMLDLAALANSRTSGIEIVDLTGSGSNTLRLSASDLLDLSDSSNTLRVDGNADDALIKAGDWAFGGTTLIGSQTYALYTQGAATLQVDVDIATAPGQLSALDGTNGFRLAGEAANDQAGISVSGAGDVNGDGFDDLIVGAYRAGPNGNNYSGASYVVFGKASGFGSNLDLSALNGANGFRLAGEAADDESGRSVSSAGDVNGDGFGDLIVGAYRADGFAGASYVVFGKSSGFASNLDLSALNGTNGFRLSGTATDDQSGISVSNAGDVNGDGFGDLIVGARYADPNGESKAGASYVVFGQGSGFAPDLALSTLDGANGFKLSGVEDYDRSGFSVSNAGDVNGDGFDDLIISGHYAAPNGIVTGASYVVFGKASGFASNLDLSALDGTNGFRLSGVALNDVAGRSVSGAGDVNGDGFGDLIVGARYADPNGTSSGASYVVFGKGSGFAPNLDLSVLDGSNGFRLSGALAGDLSGVSVSGAGDVNGDGFDDLVVGAQYADANGSNSGASYVVYGKASGFAADLNLSALDGANGFRLSGASDADQSGRSVSGAGDVDGDGFDDLIIGARYADPDGNATGASYVIFGGNFTGAVTHQGTAGADTLTGTTGADVMLSGLGNDTLTGDAGNDVLRGGKGNDSLRGNQGADTLAGDEGNDQLFGDNGNDTIAGGLGDDNFNGNNGFDTVDGGDGNDTIHGGTEFDVLSGGGGSDLVFGDKGNDTLDGGNGNDNVAGGIGNDWLAGGAGADTLDGGTEVDTADYSASPAGVNVNLGAGLALDGLGGQDVLAAIENAIGTAANDFLAGDAGANRLEGGAGDDLLYGFDPTGPGTDTGSIAATRVAAGLTQPVFAGAPAGDTARLFIVEKLGDIKILDLATNAVSPTPFLSLGSEISTDGEGGLLGLAFHPDFAQNGLFFVNVINMSGDTEIRRYQVSSTDPDQADADSGTVVLTIDQPAFTNHKAGWLGFGPDGYLYASLGDGGSGGDPFNNGQNPDSLLGKMLRLDVDGDAFPADAARNYAIPADNPFVGIPGADEIWALGLRNPWRPGFDRATGELYIADVGQNAWEEINIGQAGANYGWGRFEGPLLYNPSVALGPGTLTFPAYVYGDGVNDGAAGLSITGGYVYRGPSEGLQGQYFFADFIESRVWTLEYDGANWVAVERTGQIVPDAGTIDSISSFGEDAAGNLYIVDFGGEVFRLTPGANTADQADVLLGNGGNDMLFGGSGDDTLDGGIGNDVMNGGADVDTADYRSAPGAAIVDLLAGTASDGYGSSDTLILIENVTGSAFNDTLSGDLNANVLDGGAGDDSLSGGAGNDLVQGGLGSDVLHGNVGADTLVGDAGDDTLLGDNGNDTIAGGSGDDNINGNNGFDTVDGGAGNDTLHGGTEFDLLFGGDGNDQVFGDKGNDTTVGGAGDDTLVGGIGTDFFRYDATSIGTSDVTAGGHDVISDGTGELLSLLGLNDELQIGGTALSALSSDAILGGALSAGTSVAFAGGVLQIDVNLDGSFNAANDFQVTLTGVTTVTYNATDDLFHLA